MTNEIERELLVPVGLLAAYRGNVFKAVESQIHDVVREFPAPRLGFEWKLTASSVFTISDQAMDNYIIKCTFGQWEKPWPARRKAIRRDMRRRWAPYRIH